MKTQHTPAHWILVALVLAVLLFVLREAHGQGSATVFEGRPTMSGANGGLGAQGGMAQGGIGVQGNDTAQRSLRPGKPSGLDEMRQAKRDGQDMVETADTDMSLRKDIAPAKDTGIAKDQRSAARRIAKAARRTLQQARHGTTVIDASAER